MIFFRPELHDFTMETEVLLEERILGSGYGVHFPRIQRANKSFSILATENCPGEAKSSTRFKVARVTRDSKDGTDPFDREDPRVEMV